MLTFDDRTYKNHLDGYKADMRGHVRFPVAIGAKQTWCEHLQNVENDPKRTFAPLS
jgi:hypothetical protein